MPPTATLDDIKAYQDKVEKNQIRPHDLPPCPRCSVESCFFKIHAYRERRFLVIAKMLIQAVFCSLVQFRCPGCGKTITYYPDFAIPHKHYTRQSIMGFAAIYVENDNMTYEQAVMTEEGTPGYPQSDSTLAPSTLHRWITTLGGFIKSTQKALSLVLQENPASNVCRDLSHLSIPQRKYRKPARQETLLSCLRLVLIESFFQATFKRSIFIKLAIHCAFS